MTRPMDLARLGAARALDVAVAGLDRARERVGDARRTAAFLSGRLRFSPREDDVWVATYPRSGTTWVQYMLVLLTAEPTPDFRHIQEISPWYERSLAVGSMSPEDFERLPSPRVLKTHLVPGWLPAVGRFVHVVRDVVDVARSYFHFYRTHLGFRDDLDAFMERFVEGRLQYGSWHDHGARWQRPRPGQQVLEVRYESLVSDCAAELDRIARFLGVPASADRIDSVVTRTRFGEMKRIEAKFDHATTVLLERGITPGGFIRRGPDQPDDALPGRWISELRARAIEIRNPVHLPAFLH
jgi:hypothetical protein